MNFKHKQRARLIWLHWIDQRLEVLKKVRLTDYPNKSHFFHTITLILSVVFVAIEPFKTFKKKTQNYIILTVLISHTRAQILFLRDGLSHQNKFFCFPFRLEIIYHEENEWEEQKQKEKTKWNEKKMKHNQMFTQLYYGAQRPTFDIHMGIKNVDNKLSCLICQWNGFAIALKWTQRNGSTSNCFPAIWIDLFSF